MRRKEKRRDNKRREGKIREEISADLPIMQLLYRKYIKINMT